jgi:transcriptional regulator with XRE-family HTH domain
MEELAGLTPGQRVQFLRQRRGMTRAVVAGLCGRSPDWLKKIETDERRLTSVTLLVKLAMALGVADISVLTGTDVGMPVVAMRVYHPAIEPIRRAVRTAVYAPLPDHAHEPGELAGRVADGWRLWHSSTHQRTEVGRLLPALISDTHDAARLSEGRQRRDVYAVMTEVYALAQLVIGYVSDPELYWTVADRVQMAAREADDPTPLALAAWCLAIGLRYTADPQESITIAAGALDMITPHIAADEPIRLRAFAGALALSTAIYHAQDGREGDAWRAWDQADAIVRRLPTGYFEPATVFSRPNVDLYAVAIERALARPGAAVGKAEAVDPQAVPSTERRSRLLIDVATAHHQRHDHEAALNRLQAAYRAAPENTSIVPAARALAIAMLESRPPSLAHEVQTLAEQLGVTESTGWQAE